MGRQSQSKYLRWGPRAVKQTPGINGIKCSLGGFGEEIIPQNAVVKVTHVPTLWNNPRFKQLSQPLLAFPPWFIPLATVSEANLELGLICFSQREIPQQQRILRP